MKNQMDYRRGSALLVVLGVMSFIIISALAFAAYTRSARQPSSFLRRTSSSRLLVKAALARAIDMIDVAIGKNPHPGIGNSTAYYPRSPDVASRYQIANRWKNRVFIGGTNSTSEADSLVYGSNTVSTLTVEGLAYIPPPLVNEARYYSRITPTAQWKNLGFDAGRYAFLALDVSDYFDINRLTASFPRASSPSRRVSLAYLFENDDHTDGGTDAEKWDQFMENYRTVDPDTDEIKYDNKLPLVSMADFNLSVWNKFGEAGIGPISSLFGRYFMGSLRTSSSWFTGEGDMSDSARMTFVTDGYFPKNASDEKKIVSSGTDSGSDGEEIDIYDITESDYQPFTMDVLEDGSNPKPSIVVKGSNMNTANSESRVEWLNALGGLGAAALYDYLDEDFRPVSLALPTTERMPMICGITTRLTDGKLEIMEVEYVPSGTDVNQISGDKNTRVVEKHAYYRINPAELAKMFLGGHVRVAAVYPFNKKPAKAESYTIDGKLSMFFTSEDMSLRTGVKNDSFAFTDSNPLTQGEIVKTGDKSVFVVPLMSTSAGALPQDVKTEEDAMMPTIDLSLRSGQQVALLFAQNDNAFLHLRYEWTQTKSVDPVTGIESWKPEFSDVEKNPGNHLVDAKCSFPPLNKSGTVDSDFTGNNLLGFLKNGGSKTLKLNFAVSLRLRDSEKVIDMVPASLEDDRVQNMITDPTYNHYAPQFMQMFAGALGPVMRLDTGVSLNYSLNAFRDKSVVVSPDIQVSPQSMIVADPRYNFAPEHWFKVNDPDVCSQNVWLDNCLRRDSDKDGDIFMATSDQGYLQSVYELAMLPRFTDLRTQADNGYATYYHRPDSNFGGGKSIAADSTKIANRDIMWRTYDPFDIDRDAFKYLPFVSRGNGYKVNPYSSSTNILMAAFANTPHDWRKASTNIPSTVQGEAPVEMTANEFNKKYALNEYPSAEYSLAWDDLTRLAERFHSETVNRKNWEDAFDNLDWWGGSEKDLCGIELDNAKSDFLWSVDKKFLYGYWRDCFDVRQQLFLIFVRCEPTMMGGGGSLMPPQLGARAVALVWRDPREPEKNADDEDVVAPHRTRILFYRQLD